MASERTEQAFPAHPDARVRALIGRHGPALVRVARLCSLCHDDALDAYQRALEIYVRRLATVDPATEGAWMRVVVRHEAMAIRRARSESVAGEEVDFDTVVADRDRSVEERIASGERVQRSAEALRALKPDEARALMMKAQGLSYEEIGARNGWTYTKVNRAITEGRRRFMKVYAGIESGEECERFTPTLEALAEGRATSEQVIDIRPHLRHCTACRATVRDLNRARRRDRLTALLPFPALLAWIQSHLPGTARQTELTGPPLELTAQPSELTTRPLDVPGPPPELATPGDVASPPDLTPPPGITAPPDLTPSTLPDAADTPAITDLFQQPANVEPEASTPLQSLRDHITPLAHRANPSDVAASIHALTATGGGRISAIAATIAVCVSGLGAGAVCVVTGVIDDPLGLFEKPQRAHVERPRPAHTTPRSTATPAPNTRSVSAELAAVRREPTPTPTPRVPRTPARRAPTSPSTPPSATQNQAANEFSLPASTAPHDEVILDAGEPRASDASATEVQPSTSDPAEKEFSP